MELDNLLTSIGNGKFQILAMVVAFSAALSVSAVNYAYVFISSVPDHWCQLPVLPEYFNLSQEDKKHLLLPLELREGLERYSQCHQYTHQNNSTNSLAASADNISREIAPCKTWEYDTAGFISAVVDWNLVCDREWLAESIASVFIIGCIFGSFLFGRMADVLGRKKVVLVCAIGHVASALPSCISPNIWIFLVTRFFAGLFTNALHAIGSIIISENVVGACRLKMQTVISIISDCGIILDAAIAKFVSSWSSLQLGMLTPTVTIFVIFFLPESPRWLYSKGKMEETRKSISAIARINNVELPNDILSETNHNSNHNKTDNENVDLGCSMLYKSPVLRRILFILSCCLFIIYLVFFHIVYNISNSGFDLILTKILQCIVIIVPSIFIPCSFIWPGRRWTMFILSVFGGISLLSTTMVPTDMANLKSVFYMLSLVGVGTASHLAIICSPELFPSAVRGVGMGICFASCRTAGILAAYTPCLNRFDPELVTVTFGILLLLCGVLALGIPENDSLSLLDNIEDISKLGMRSSCPETGESKFTEKSKLVKR